MHLSIRNLLYPTLLAALLALLTWTILFWDPQPDAGSGHDPLTIATAPTGGDFLLQSNRGSVALKALRGKVVVLFFGYTWCPDICPTSLGYLSIALKKLTDEELESLQTLFISVDPERDTLERLQDYGAYFHSNILGVTGSPDQVAQVAGRYGAAYHKVNNGPDPNYTVDHSADIYIIDRNGKLARTLPYGTTPEDLLTTLKAQIKKSEVH